MELFTPPRLIGDITTSLDRCIWFNHSQYLEKVYEKIRMKEAADRVAAALEARQVKDFGRAPRILDAM
jgi:hypothetical protein